MGPIEFKNLNDAFNSLYEKQQIDETNRDILRGLSLKGDQNLQNTWNNYLINKDDLQLCDSLNTICAVVIKQRGSKNDRGSNQQPDNGGFGLGINLMKESVPKSDIDNSGDFSRADNQENRQEFYDLKN